MTLQELSKIKLLNPLKDMYVTQPFGVNFVGFYEKLGMKGHNGIDFRANNGCPIVATHAGEITFSGTDNGGGVCIIIDSALKGEGFKTIYYHLKKVNVAKGEKVVAGDLIGWADNTGKYTTGSHLHFGLKETYNGATVNTDNGFFGAIDPAPYFIKNYDKTNAYHRYGRKGNYFAELKMRFKNPWLHRQLAKRNQMKLIYDNEWINALIYGGWGFEDVMNPAMWDIWAYLKKDEYTRGKKPFC